MDLIGPISDLFKCVCSPICEYFDYYRKLDENMEELDRVLRELENKKKDIEATLSRAEREQGKKPSNEVSDWLKNVQRINTKAESFKQEVEKGNCFSRACLGKDVEKKIEEVKEYIQKGCAFTSYVSDAPSTSGMTLSTTSNLVGERTGKIVEEIWEDLMGDKVSKIGVWGMGGIGKTTIMSHINNKLQEKPNKFNDVIWVTVSQPLDLFKLQTDIATALKQSLSENEDKVRRAGRLLGMLKAKEKFVLILDDMWEAFPLEEVGIPEPSEENGSKLVITTRSHRVCRSMKCKQVAVELLSKQEAFNLFIDGVGNSILQVPALNKEIINEVVEECGRLPLAIVTVAASMSGEEEIHEWRNALNELRGLVRSRNGVNADVLGRLEFSYHRLKDEKLQQCFLYCALYPEDFAIPKDELIDYWIAEGFIEEVKDVQAKYDRGHTILNRLVNCCLLESAEDGSCVKMHDLIRDMALRITSESPLFMVKAGLRLLKFPGEQEWEENLERVSLMRNNIEEIPSNMSPHCEILSTLLLQRNGLLQRIPECFFVHMHGLKVLNLSHTDIEVLPSSVSDLTNLRSLLLRYCLRLRRVPSVAKLLALHYLDLEATRIEEVPEGMEMLENLSYLYLYSLPLKKFPTGILPRLRDLYKLKLSFGREALRETVEEAARLSNRLDTFEGHFSTLKDFNIYVKSTDGRGSKNYCLLLSASDMRGILITDLEVDKSVSLMNCKICEREEPIVLPEDVQFLQMFEVSDVASLNDVLPREQGLVNIGKFSHDLKVLSFVRCPNLKNLFSLQLLPALQNLEVLKVKVCFSIEEIVVVEDEETEKELATNTIINTVTLPRLKRLGFYFLPEFKSFCSNNGVLVCNSLQEIEVRGCPKLKRLSLSLPLLDNGQPSPPAALKVIEIKKELWETLEWDQANAKDVLNPYCKFVGF
ncbi:probable disease resistance protein At5g43730 isoform X2 [Citrus sinensis]|uniref:probable disease resistance protein At5g43730 isoform X2 n=1 Tax=Citrus sinensis TaxID=2711 RepID=UPI00227741A7|nr:probable disease resistance protein At5g43730 isoform X2 [Citrus sinensis]